MAEFYVSNVAYINRHTVWSAYDDVLDIRYRFDETHAAHYGPLTRLFNYIAAHVVVRSLHGFNNSR